MSGNALTHIKNPNTEMQSRGFYVSIAIHGILCLLFLGLTIENSPFRLTSTAPADVENVPIEWIANKPAVDTTPKMVETLVDDQADASKVKNRFQSDKTRTVLKETVARNTGRPTESVMPEKGSSKSKSGAKKSEPTLSDLGLMSKRNEILVPSDNPVEMAERNNQPRQNNRGQLGAGGEWMEGLPLSAETALNTAEYKYFSYFQRIRTLLDQAWQPILRQRLRTFFATGRQLASDYNHITRTVVTLNKVGEVIKVQLLEASGTRDLDDSAVDAFNKAGPFPNPPQGLINGANTIEIRWDFVLRT